MRNILPLVAAFAHHVFRVRGRARSGGGRCDTTDWLAKTLRASSSLRRLGWSARAADWARGAPCMTSKMLSCQQDMSARLLITNVQIVRWRSSARTSDSHGARPTNVL
jgi:hypothetical protein